MITGAQTTSTTDAIIGRGEARSGTRCSYTDDPVQLLENMMTAKTQWKPTMKYAFPMATAAATAYCDISCVEDDQIVEVNRATFRCVRHNRQHVCDPVCGDDHPLMQISNRGHYTCLFSNYVVGQVMLFQDYSDTDPTSRRVAERLDPLINAVVSEADRCPFKREFSRRKFGDDRAGADPVSEEETSSDLDTPAAASDDEAGLGSVPSRPIPGTKHLRKLQEKERLSGKRGRPPEDVRDDDDETGEAFDSLSDGSPSPKRLKLRCSSLSVPRLHVKLAVEVVRSKTLDVLRTLCDCDTRSEILKTHATQAESEMLRNLLIYKKQCWRQKMKCIVQIKEQIVLQTLRKHQRYVPRVTESQMELWLSVVVLMWEHFAPHRRRSRAGVEGGSEDRESNAGVVPFIFGCLYAMSEGSKYGGSELIRRDPAMAVVMPPAVDLCEFGYKYNCKSTGRKAMERAVNCSIAHGAIPIFVSALSDMRKRMLVNRAITMDP